MMVISSHMVLFIFLKTNSSHLPRGLFEKETHLPTPGVSGATLISGRVNEC